MIRMDGLILSKAGTSIGQYVEVKGATWEEAKHVSLAPFTQGMQIFAPGYVLTKVFNGGSRLSCAIIATSSVRMLPTYSLVSETSFEAIFRCFLTRGLEMISPLNSGRPLKALVMTSPGAKICMPWVTGASVTCLASSQVPLLTSTY